MIMQEPDFNKRIALKIRNTVGIGVGWEVYDEASRSMLPLTAIDIHLGNDQIEQYTTATITVPVSVLMLFAQEKPIPVPIELQNSIDGYMTLCIRNETGKFVDTSIWDGRTGAVLDTCDWIKLEMQRNRLGNDFLLTFRCLFDTAEITGGLHKVAS